MATRQPLLHDAAIALRAPAQAWSRPDGSMEEGADGLWLSDVRIVSRHAVVVAGSPVEPIGSVRLGADRIRFSALLRGLDDGATADPRVRLDLERTVAADGMREVLTLSSGRDVPLETEIRVRLAADLAPMALVKTGGAGDPLVLRIGDGRAEWGAGPVTAAATADGMVVAAAGTGADLVWHARVGPHGTATASWSVRAVDRSAVVAAPPAPIVLGAAATGDPDLDDWTAVALADLEALQLVLPDAPGDVFLAAGAPWFLTLFGRDAIWAARMLLPHDVALAAGTLRVLARLQGRVDDDATGERPGGVLHELRRDENPLADGLVLPPRYYGTIDATPLWILLLHDAWRAGLPDREVANLLPNLLAALEWLRDAVPEGGFLAYHDASGRGLANQGWKDSADSVQWADGRLAEGPIALCEVQAYAHEAALAAGVLLRAFGDVAAARWWEAWAGRLRARFRRAFWVDGPGG